MPDVPEGAAEIIAQAVLGQAGWFDGHMLLATLDGWDSSDEEVGQLALAALAAAGFAVVQLPEPSYVDDPEGNGEKGYGFNGPGGPVTTLAEHGVYAYDGLVFDQYDGWTPEQARTIASWWLAAAAVSGANKIEI